MKNNATINARLKDLLDVLDARTTVNIFVEKNGQTSVKYSYVYELLGDPEFMRRFSDYKVIGLGLSLSSTNILIKEA